ncbi:MAG: hypothetical protein LBR68_04125 [Lachnoclostridium sp.]|nr:hypothetical protein [Lachnoclostridium sp.]
MTKIGRADGSFTNEEKLKQYWYHSDHLGSAQLITNVEGEEYERIEYTPYGELWVERASAASNIDIPYRFTGKERDEETGLYYYGARYLDPKTSRWLSADPALSEYIPGAPINDEARKRNSNLPGMGGMFNTVNLHLYHYAGNNPVKYLDPDGRSPKSHIDKQGTERIKAEAKDMFGLSIKYGLSGGGTIRAFGLIKISLDVDAGSLEVTQDKNGLDSKNTAGISLEIEALDKVGISAGKSIETPASDSDEFIDHIVNVYKNGEVKNDAEGIFNIKGPVKLTAEADGDTKFEVGAQFGIGGKVWFNATEFVDFLKYLFSNKDE